MFQYTGRENDGNGLYYYRARYYNPSIGRFISEDPIGFRGGINFYAYVRNNPTLFKDPTGRDCSPTQWSWWEKASMILPCLAGLDPDYVSPQDGPQDSTDSPEPVNGQHLLPGPRKRPLNPGGGNSSTPDGMAYGYSALDCLVRVWRLPSCPSCTSAPPFHGTPENPFPGSENTPIGP